MGLLDSISDKVSGALNSASETADDLGKVSKIPLRGVLWDIDLADPQKFTLTPMGRGLLAAGALYGAFKMLGGR